MKGMLEISILGQCLGREHRKAASGGLGQAGVCLSAQPCSSLGEAQVLMRPELRNLTHYQCSHGQGSQSEGSHTSGKLWVVQREPQCLTERRSTCCSSGCSLSRKSSLSTEMNKRLA